MTESSSRSPVSVADAVRDLCRRHRFLVLWTAFHASGYLVVSKVVVPETDRNAGIGTDVMTTLTAAADAMQAPMALTPSTDFGGDLNRLRAFYRRFGFVPNRGSSHDYVTSETMIRPPIPPIVAGLHTVLPPTSPYGPDEGKSDVHDIEQKPSEPAS